MVVEPERGHSNHDQPRVDGGEVVVADAPVLEHSWAEVLDDDVG